MLDIALDAHRGSFHLQVDATFAAHWTVVFGPSGAGKSTLLRLIAGLDRGSIGASSHARVLFHAQPLTETSSRIWLAPGHRHTALVTQQPALFPHLTVAENVAYGLPHLDRKLRSQRVLEMLDLVDARSLLQRRPQGLSGGEAQRIALARALAPAPRLLLLDEPFSALDGSTSDALLDRLHAWLARHRIQTILATHDAADAFATSAEVALLREGRLAALGPAAQVLSEERARLLQRLASQE